MNARTTSLRLRFAVYFIGLSLVPVALLGWITGQRSFESLEEQSLLIQREVALNVGSQIRDFIHSREDQLLLFDRVYGLVLQDRELQRATLSNMLQHERVFHEMTLNDADGQEIMRLSRTHLFLDSELISRVDQPEFTTDRVPVPPPGNPIVALVDRKMPKMDGLELLNNVKADPDFKSIPAVMLTSSREDQDIISSYSTGANAYVVKPVSFDVFIQVIKQLGLFWVLTNQSLTN